MQTRQRKSIRLKDHDYTLPGGYYVTLVTLWRECLFGQVVGGEMQVNPLGKIAQECWEEIPSHFPQVDVDAFVIMPNHVHGIIIIHDKKIADIGNVVGAQYIAPDPQRAQHAAPLQNVRPGSLGAIVRSFKSAVTRRAGRELNIANIWQRTYYEHILRDQADYERIAGYILDNPSNWANDEENPQG